MLKTRLEKFYEKIVCEDLILLYNLKNIYTLPVFDKAVLNSTSKTLVSEKEALLQQFSAFFLQTGSLPVKTRAHKSIALFNIRQGNILGLKTTLRKQSLYNYLDKSLIFVIPKTLSFTSLQKPIESPSTGSSSSPSVKDSLGFTKGDAEASPLVKRNVNAKEKWIDRESLVALTTTTKKNASNKKLSRNNSYKDSAIQLKRKKDFVISEKEITRFPEVSSLLLFFNSTTGFSLSCSFSLYGQRSLPKSKFLSKEKKKNIGCNKKKIFISAFGYPSH